MAYNKKNIFDGAVLNITGSKALEADFVSQLNSTIMLNGAELQKYSLDVDALYNSGTMKKVK